MDFKEYNKVFHDQAIALGISPNAIATTLKYAEQLHKKNLPIIYDQQHFCRLVGYDEVYVTTVANYAELFYKEFESVVENKV